MGDLDQFGQLYQGRHKARLVNETLSIVDIHESHSIGPGVGCIAGFCAGFKLSASGDVDLDFDAHMFLGGNYKLAYKSNQTTGAVPLDPNKAVNSQFVLGTGMDPIGITKLDYQNLLATANFGLTGDIGAKVSGQGCLAACLGGSISVDPPPFELDLISIQNKSLDVLGVNIGSLPVQYTDPKGIVSISADLPQFQKSFTNVPPGSGVTYTSEQNVAKLNVDAAAAAAALLGLPPLKGSVGPIDYSLLSVNGWAGLDLRDNFQLTPTALSTTYAFSAPVEVLDDATGTWSAPTTSLTLPDGQLRTLRAPGAVTLGILPTYNLEVQGSTGLELIAAVGYDASALKSRCVRRAFGTAVPRQRLAPDRVDRSRDRQSEYDGEDERLGIETRVHADAGGLDQRPANHLCRRVTTGLPRRRQRDGRKRVGTQCHRRGLYA